MNILNNRFYILLEKLSNLLLLNLCWIIASIPIITLFPATAAMFSVIRDWKIKDEVSVIKPFMIHFKKNFKQSLLIGILWVPFALLLYFDYFYIVQTQTEWRVYLLVPLFFIALLFTFMSAFLFPVMIHYQLRIRDVLKNTFIVSLVYFPTTIVSIILAVSLLAILLFFPITGLFIFSVAAYLNFLLCNRVFQKIEKLKVATSQ
ncbi:YesL family protein [Pseudogracilibacillus auburnensis]|uniref:YesL family protein n=1 Tax=Pseudogracilibacillus auburnensis TaxID=1494959 RepID=UPI001A95804A|nr:DUF624 domain-containing protein [Pseudogracilibacillus auburnensis]MBO1005129.1 DUF624 domain-containing protein [Pseudogracilibacillus auburnensis]